MAIDHEADPSTTWSGIRWHELADRVLRGERLTPDEGLAVLRSDDRELLDLLSAASRVRYQHFGDRVSLNLLINAKSGLCPEDCGYCSQSKVSQAEVPQYGLVSPERILEGAALASARRARTYCIAVSGRSPTEKEIETLEQVVPRIRTELGLRVCVSPGLLSRDQAERIAACGVNRVNHNLNSSQRFYPRICTTHLYQDRLQTLYAVREAGMELCSGVIVGMGEEDEDVVSMALALAELAVEALPVNFLNPIPGTPLEGVRRLNPRYCLKVLALFRLAVPRCELRMSAGREIHLGSLQALGLYAANSMFVGGYLTTQGRPPEEDHRMVEALGLQIVREGAHARTQGHRAE